MKFQRSYEIQRTPLQSVSPDELKRAAPEFRYAVMDGSGRVALAAVARPGDDATFRVDLKGKLAPGRYTVLAAIIVNGNAMNAEIERIPVVISSNL